MREITKDATSQTLYIVLRDSTTGLGKTGLIHSDITGSYTRNRAARTAITMATLASASAAWSSGGFVEVDGTNAKGLYRFDVPDAAFATGVRNVIISVAATGVITEHEEVILTGWDNQDAVRGGMTALPNANAEAAGGLYTRGTGAGQINQPANGMIDVNQVRLGGSAQSTTDLKDFADDGYDPSTNKVQGVVLTDTVTTYTGNTPQTGDAFARLGAPAGASVSADIAGVQADTDDIQTRLPATLSGGRMRSDAEAISGSTAAADAVEANIGNLDAAVSTRASQASVDTIDDFLDTEVAAILADTNELQTDWANGGRLDNILDARASQTSVDDLPTNAELSAALAAADDAVLAAIAALNNLSAAQVNAEVVDVIRTDLVAELGAVPAANAPLSDKINWLYLLARNTLTQSATTATIKADDGTTTVATAATSDSGTLFTRSEWS